MSFAFARGKPQPATMLFRQCSAEIQPQSCSTNTGRLGIVSAHKAPKDPRRLMQWNTYTLVLYVNLNFLACVRLAKCDANRAALGAILDSISEKIGKNLLIRCGSITASNRLAEEIKLS